MFAFMISVTFTVALVMNGNTIYVDEVECEDIKGVEKWSSEGHDDNNPSEKKILQLTGNI
jgi:hypothetical protein